jgi:hypothetical protein
MDKVWQQQLLQIGGQPLLDVMMAIHDRQVEQGAKIENVEKIVVALARGFPGNDIEGHRRYHESLISWHNLRNQVLRAALEKVVQAGALASFVFLGKLLWDWLMLEVKK